MISPDMLKVMERQLEDAGVGMDLFFSEAGITKTTWWRWTHEKFQPRMDKWQSVQSAHRKLIEQADAA